MHVCTRWCTLTCEWVCTYVSEGRDMHMCLHECACGCAGERVQGGSKRIPALPRSLVQFITA